MRATLSSLLLLGVLFVACSRNSNYREARVATEDLASDEEVDASAHDNVAKTDKVLTSDEILRTVQYHVPDVKPLPANVDVEELLAGHYSDTKHVFGGGLSGTEFYLFPDKTYFCIRWADIFPHTITDKGKWQWQDGFLVLLSDGSVPGKFGRPLDHKYLPLILPTDRPTLFTKTPQPKQEELLLLLGADRHFLLFLFNDPKVLEGTRGLRLAEPESTLRMCTYSKAESITSEEAGKLRNKLFEDCWHPDRLE